MNSYSLIIYRIKGSSFFFFESKKYLLVYFWDQVAYSLSAVNNDVTNVLCHLWWLRPQYDTRFLMMLLWYFGTAIPFDGTKTVGSLAEMEEHELLREILQYHYFLKNCYYLPCIEFWIEPRREGNGDITKKDYLLICVRFMRGHRFGVFDYL